MFELQVAQSIATINQRLHEIMPPSMFCAATMIEVDETWRHAQLFTAGMPPVLLNHTRTGRTTSWETKELPLGILSSGQLSFPLRPIALEEGDRLYIYSDGVTEQRNPQEELFGQVRLEQMISSLQPGLNVTQVLREHIGNFKGHQAASDDLTFLELTIVAPKADISRTHESGIWAAMPEKAS